MKIIMTNEELTAACKVLVGMDAKVTDFKGVEVKVLEGDGSAVVTIEAGLIVDYLGLILNMTPLIKGVVAHMMSTWEAIMAMGQQWESKWIVPRKPIDWQIKSVKTEREAI